MRRLAVLLVLFAACSHDVPLPSVTKAAAPVRTHADWPQFALVDPAALSGRSASARNVFSFQEAPRPVVVVRQVDVVKRTPDIIIAKGDDGPKEPEKKPVLGFPYRYIGRFGPEGQQLAAFAGGGVVKVAKAGELIDGRFLLRAVGIESVEVALAASPEVAEILEIGK
jgi:hypothetical protein